MESQAISSGFSIHNSRQNILNWIGSLPVHGAEHEAEEGADAVGDADAHDDAEDAGEGEVGALLHAVEPAEVGQDEGEDHHVADAEHSLDGRTGIVKKLDPVLRDVASRLRVNAT